MRVGVTVGVTIGVELGGSIVAVGVRDRVAVGVMAPMGLGLAVGFPTSVLLGQGVGLLVGGAACVGVPWGVAQKSPRAGLAKAISPPVSMAMSAWMTSKTPGLRGLTTMKGQVE